jgi:hypothetical protein
MSQRLFATAALFFFALPSLAAEREARFVEKLAAVHEAGVALYKSGCPKPIRTTRTPTQNVHDPAVMDTVLVAHCPGVEIGTYRANGTKPSSDIPAAVVLKDRKRKLPHELGVGSSKKAVEASLGAPDRENGSRADYYFDKDGPGSDVISFEYGGAQVKRVIWSFHVE